jgi:hypothetical protein
VVVELAFAVAFGCDAPVPPDVLDAGLADAEAAFASQIGRAHV